MAAPLFRRKGFPQHKFPAVLDNPPPIPFIPPEFPSPIPAQQRGTIDVAVSLLLTTLAVVTAVQNVVIRDPLYSVAGRAKSAPEWQIPPNLLTTTLVPVAAATPFKPVDLPLNRRVVNVPQFDPVRNISVLQLQAAPFKPVDLPLSRKALQVSQFDPPNVLINIPVTGTPFYAPYVTPIQGAVRQVLGFDPPNVTINLPSTVAAPFKPYDWTTPGRARSASDWSNGQNIVLVNAKPFIPVDWSLAQQAKQQVKPFEPPNLALATLTLAQPPFVVIFDWRPTQNPWQPFLDTIPNLLTSTFNPTSPPIPPVVVTDQFSGGWPIYAKRDPEHVKRKRIELGILPPEEEQKAEKAIDLAVQSAVALSQAKPETKEAADALQAQQRAQDLFLAAYLRVYPELERQRILEALRLEAHRLVLLQEEEFAIVLSML